MKREIRPLSEGDWPVLKDIRLRALADSPDAFGPTLEETIERAEEYWQTWAAGGWPGAPARFQLFAAFDDGQAVGIISARFAPERAGLGALWVAPEARRTGLGEALMQAGEAWLVGQGAETIGLSVTDGNGAEALYLQRGYERTGERNPLRPGSPVFEVTMSRHVTPGSA